jgi:hypothetical protein
MRVQHLLWSTVGIPKANTQQLLPQKYWCTHSRHYKELAPTNSRTKDRRGIDSSGLIGMAPVRRAPSARSQSSYVSRTRGNASVFVLAVTANDWCKRWHYILGLDPQDIRLSSPTGISLTDGNQFDRPPVTAVIYSYASCKPEAMHPLLAVTADDW